MSEGFGDFRDIKLKDWRDADVIYMNCTCFDDKMIDDVTSLAGTVSIYCIY
jgi:hypothetical protein